MKLERGFYVEVWETKKGVRTRLTRVGPQPKCVAQNIAKVSGDLLPDAFEVLVVESDEQVFGPGGLNETSK